MKAETANAVSQTNFDRSIKERDPEVTALVRCKAYSLFSLVFTSLHEIDVEQQLRGDRGFRNLVPYGIDLEALRSCYLSVNSTDRKQQYSRLFEIGDSGPPVSIREQQQFSQTAGIREDLIRFYKFFDYDLHQRFSWAPDHLSVILEFTHLLCYRESIDSNDRLSYQLAQYDFVLRHLLNWSPVFADSVEQAAPNSLYAEIARTLCQFVSRDYEWQTSTLSHVERSSTGD